MAKPGTGQRARDGAYYRGTASSFILAALTCSLISP